MNAYPEISRSVNLREATAAQNQRNRGRQRNNRSGIKGVCLTNPGRSTWKASIQANGRVIYLGSFISKQLAAEAYTKAAKKLHGQFACVA